MSVNHKDSMEKPAWERKETESALAYEAFCVYRDMGIGRSLDKAYRVKQNLPETSKKVAPSNWRGWSGEYDWVARVRQFDEYMEGKQRDKRESDYLATLTAHREQQRILADSALNLSTNLLILTNKKIAAMVAASEEIPTNLLPSYTRAAAAVAETVTMAKSQMLAVDELLRELHSQKGA